MVPDAYDECARCGKFYYSHEAQELSRRERHAFTPREAVPSELSTLRAKLAEVEAERDGAVAVLRRIAEELPSDQTTTAKLAVRAALFQRFAREYLAETAGKDAFRCCGGNDEHPKFHCSDCDEHPWSGEPDPRCVANPRSCVHATAGKEVQRNGQSGFEATHPMGPSWKEGVR